MLFRKKSKEKENVSCAQLTVTSECSIISQIRQWQKELDEANNKIKQLENIEYIDVEELYKFVMSDEFMWLAYEHTQCRNRRPGWINVNGVYSIHKAVNQIDNLDKFFDEIRIIYDRTNLIAQENHKAAELRNKISEAKTQLGIQ